MRVLVLNTKAMRIQKMLRRVLLLSLALTFGFTGTVCAQAQAKRKAKAKADSERPGPTAADFAYGHDSPRQVFDFWQAKSDKPTPLVLCIHGGGWRGGDKSGYGEKAIRPYLDAGISVAAINYRYIQ